jgi:hypothetical protein
MSKTSAEAERLAPLSSISELLEEAYVEGRIKLDLKGHYKHRGFISAEAFVAEFGAVCGFSPTSWSVCGKDGWPTEAQAWDLLRWLRKEPGAEPVYGLPMDGLLMFLHTWHCFVCGDGKLADGARLNGNVIEVGTKCPHPKGFGPIKIKLWVPSGYLVVENDLRDLFPAIEPETSVNYHAGLVLTSKAYEEVGMAHGFVGNTCPAVYRINSGSFTLGGKTPRRGAKEVAGVCTDLWWYSIVDRDEYLDRADPEWRKAEDPAQKATELLKNVHVVKCKPGLYEVKHQFHCLEDRDDGTPYAIIQWKSARPKVLPDYRRNYLQYDFTAGQILRRHIKDYPTLYQQRCRTSVLDREPCTLQESYAMAANALLLNGSNKYHPNGWAGGYYEMCAEPQEDVAVPHFDRPLPYVSDLSDFSFIAVAVGLGNKFSRAFDKVRSDGTLYLNPSFVSLGFNFLRVQR